LNAVPSGRLAVLLATTGRMSLGCPQRRTLAELRPKAEVIDKARAAFVIGRGVAPEYFGNGLEPGPRVCSQFAS
jgi:hypothetical protein